MAINGYCQVVKESIVAVRLLEVNGVCHAQTRENPQQF
jgi:hypothetical protein